MLELPTKRAVDFDTGLREQRLESGGIPGFVPIRLVELGAFAVYDFDCFWIVEGVDTRAQPDYFAILFVQGDVVFAERASPDPMEVPEFGDSGHYRPTNRSQRRD